MESPTDFHTRLPILLNWYKLLNIIKPPRSADREAFYRTIFYGRFSPKDYTYTTALELMEKILGAIVLLTETFCPEEIIDTYLLHLRERYQIKQWWAESWLKCACDSARHRRFFCHEHGPYRDIS